MTKHVKAFLIKLVRFTFNLSLFIGIVFHEPLRLIAILLCVLPIVTYILGDLIALRLLGGSSALLLDFCLIFGGVWVIHILNGVPVHFSQFFLFGLITIALCVEEFAYHIYIERNILGKDRPSLMEMINNL